MSQVSIRPHMCGGTHQSAVYSVLYEHTVLLELPPLATRTIIASPEIDRVAVCRATQENPVGAVPIGDLDIVDIGKSFYQCYGPLLATRTIISSPEIDRVAVCRAAQQRLGRGQPAQDLDVSVVA